MKSLRIAYKDELSDFETMQEKDHAVTIYVMNLQVLMTGVFKTEHSLNPTFMKEIFEKWQCEKITDPSVIQTRDP